MTEPISIYKPEKTTIPLILDSPHSGCDYPADFDFACDLETLRSAEDHFVDDLFADAPRYGASLLLARFPRSYIDVNRCDKDIDAELLERPWTESHHPIAPTNRSDAGIGLIRRLVRPGIPVYNRNLSSAEIIHRIEDYYRPYYNTLTDLIENAHYKFGQVFHINCHSMPASSAYPKRPVGLIGNKAKPSDFVLGDRNATTCDPAFTRALRDFIQGLGYTVTINDPFKGVELIKRYSSPMRGYHSLQIEINKALYMNEETMTKNDNYGRLKEDINKTMAFIAGYIQNRLVSLAAD